MPLTLMRRIRFCAVHRLYRHGGKCEFFHGHNYVVDFHVTADEVDSVGRLVDFAELKRAFKGWIDEHWDHGFLLAADDLNGLDAIRRVEPCRYYILPSNPTAENMARHLLDEIAPKLLEPFADAGVRATKVVVWETEDSYAEASVATDAPHPSRSEGFEVGR